MVRSVGRLGSAACPVPPVPGCCRGVSCSEPMQWEIDVTAKRRIRLEYIGRQGMCRYYWRVFLNGTRVLYAKVDKGLLQPVAY